MNSFVDNQRLNIIEFEYIKSFETKKYSKKYMIPYINILKKYLKTIMIKWIILIEM